MKTASTRRLALAAVLALVVLAYLPGLRGPFVFDDYPNIVNNPTVAVTTLTVQNLYTAATSNTSGPLGRPLAALSFALDHYRAGGFYPLAFKLTNLAIHLLNVLLVYALVGRVARRLGAGESSAAVALFTALLWGLHPLQLTSVLYVVQRMTSLSALWVLAGGWLWLAGRQRLAEDRRGGAALLLSSLVVGVGLGALAKENALLLPLYLAVLELCLWRGTGAAHDQGRRFANGFFAVTVLAPALLGLGLLAWQPGWLLDGYGGRPFTLGERLLTEARVLWFYVGLILLPTPGRLGLYHDDIALSTGLLAPWTTLAALAGWLLALAAAIALRRRAPVVTLAVLWFLAGHAMESTVVPLEIAHEHRNYLPSLGPLLATVYGVTVFARRTGRAALYGALGVATSLALGFGTFGRSATWHSEETIIEALYRQHPQSASAQQMMGELMLHRRGQPAQAAEHYQRAYALAPWETGYRLRALRARRTAGGALPDATEHQAIVSALRSRPLPPTTLLALGSLSACALAGEPACRDLTPALLDWLTAAAENPRINTVSLTQVTMNYGQICLQTGRFEQGLDWVRAAYRQTPQPVYRLMEANFLMLQGRFELTAAVLADVHQLPGLSATDRGHLKVLEQALSRRRAEAELTAAD